MSAVLADTPPVARASGVVELRQYTLQPGRREALIGLFEREFVHTQEAVGMDVLGTFRDLDAPDRFTWLRGFADMPARRRALTAFYDGPAWKAHREAANATMIDSDNVHLLRPVGAFTLPMRDSAPGERGVVVAMLYPLHAGGGETFAAFFERAVAPLVWEANIPLLARFVTETAVNDFARLPVRADDTVFAWLAAFPDARRADQALARLQAALDWTPSVAEPLRRLLQHPPQVLRLAPTSTSRLRG